MLQERLESVEIFGWMQDVIILHGAETEPQYPDLEDAQQGREACDSTDLPAAGHILRTPRKDQDIGEGGGS